MPQRFSIFPSLLTAGTTVTVILIDDAGGTYPFTADVVYFDGNGNEIGGNGILPFTAKGQGHPINIPENARSLQIRSAQSQTLTKIVSP